MAGRFYMAPSAHRTGPNEATFSSHPTSDTINLKNVHDQGETSSATISNAVPPCDPAVYQRNRALIEKHREKQQKEWFESEELMKRLRKQRQQWLSDATPSQTQEEEEEDTAVSRQWKTLNDSVPSAFQFHKYPETMKLHWTQGSLSDQSAVLKPTPSKLLTPLHDIATENDPSRIILRISFYSRQLKRSTRLTRLRAAAEKRTSEHKNQDIDNDGSEKARQEALFEPFFGASQGEEQSDQRPDQKIDIAATDTLDGLRRAMICRCDDLPATDDNGRYTGRKRNDEGTEAKDTVVIVENEIFHSPDHASISDSIMARYNQQHQTTLTQRSSSLNAIKLIDLPPIQTNKAYYMLHQDICEHIWVIDEIVLATSLPSSDTLPSTTYLSTHALQHPLSIFARTKHSDTHYPVSICTLCNRYTAKYIILSHHNLQAHQIPEPEDLVLLASLKEDVSPVCPNCLSLWIGVMPSVRSTRKQAKRKKKKADDPEDDEEEGKTQEDAQNWIQNVASQNADRSEDTLWLKVKDKLQKIDEYFKGESRWTVVPILD
ncbi:unnamed protein product [Sympodiomycopsis kandeliae]